MISVCLATYEGEKYLEEQLDSIVPQLLEGDELLISDDGSSDCTLAILEKYRGPQTHIFTNQFQSAVRNFEFLLGQVSKPLVVLCDQDDIWLPTKLATVRQHLDNQSRTCLLMNAGLIDGHGKPTGQTSFKKWRTRKGFWPNLWRNTFMGSSMAFTADLLDTALPFPKEIAMHDWWIGLLAEKTGKVKLLQETVMLYRLHGGNQSLQGSTMKQKLRWRAKMLRAIQKRLKNG